MTLHLFLMYYKAIILSRSLSTSVTEKGIHKDGGLSLYCHKVVFGFILTSKWRNRYVLVRTYVVVVKYVVGGAETIMDMFIFNLYL